MAEERRLNIGPPSLSPSAPLSVIIGTSSWRHRTPVLNCKCLRSLSRHHVRGEREGRKEGTAGEEIHLEIIAMQNARVGRARAAKKSLTGIGTTCSRRSSPERAGRVGGGDVLFGSVEKTLNFWHCQNGID